MEDSSSFLIKTLIGSAFAIGGGLYLYFSLFKGDDNNQNIITDYIREYINILSEKYYNKSGNDWILEEYKAKIVSQK